MPGPRVVAGGHIRPKWASLGWKQKRKCHFWKDVMLVFWWRAGSAKFLPTFYFKANAPKAYVRELIYWTIYHNNYIMISYLIFVKIKKSQWLEYLFGWAWLPRLFTTSSPTTDACHQETMPKSMSLTRCDLVVLEPAGQGSPAFWCGLFVHFSKTLPGFKSV